MDSNCNIHLKNTYRVHCINWLLQKHFSVKTSICNICTQIKPRMFPNLSKLSAVLPSGTYNLDVALLFCMYNCKKKGLLDLQKFESYLVYFDTVFEQSINC